MQPQFWKSWKIFSFLVFTGHVHRYDFQKSASIVCLMLYYLWTRRSWHSTVHAMTSKHKIPSFPSLERLTLYQYATNKEDWRWKWQIIGMRDTGMKQADIARALNVSQSVMSRLTRRKNVQVQQPSKIKNKKCHKHVTNAPKGICLA